MEVHHTVFFRIFKIIVKTGLNPKSPTLLVLLRNKNKLEIKSNAYTEALQYRQDLIFITRSEHTSLSIHVVQKITIISEQKIGKSAF